MAGLAPEGLQFDGRKFDAKMNELLQADGCDENLQEDLLRGISANVMVGLAPEGSQFDGCQFDAKSKELLQVDGGDEFLSSYHEDYDSLGLQENLPTGIYAYGFEKPSAIQQRGIVPSCTGLDVIQHAQSENAKFNPKCEIQPENEELTPEQYAIAEEWLQSIGFDKDFPSFDELLDKLDCMVYGCVKPSAIQQRRIVPSCKGLDVIQQAQSENTKFNPECKFQSLQSIKNELEKCVARGDLRRSKLR